jgi:pentachlorophenol monooxygenase/3-(3-hydroxy-phenyl)propionate hydroxylase
VPIAGAGATRLRQICRDGVLLLAGSAVDIAPLRRVAAAPGGAPVRVVPQAAVSPDGALAAALGSRPHEVWVIRPDAHVAAVLDRPDAAAVVAAIDRLLGRSYSTTLVTK